MLKRVIIGQVLLIICCIIYIIWWYRGFRPGSTVSRVGGINGILLFLTMAVGVAGLALTLISLPRSAEPMINPMYIVIAGIVGYVVLLLITKIGFHRAVTTELFLITGWTMLEVAVVNKLNAAENISLTEMLVMLAVIVVAFLISMILYVAYYRMDEMKAFYAAMVPLVTEGATMALLVGMMLRKA